MTRSATMRNLAAASAPAAGPRRAPASSRAFARPTTPASPEGGASPSRLIGAAEAGTLPGLFLARVAQTPDRAAYVAWDADRSTWRAFSWSAMGQRMSQYRTALQRTGLRSGERVGLLLPNSPDWVAFDVAALSLGLVIVPLYLRDGTDNHVRILARSGARLLMTDTADRWTALAAAAKGILAVEHVWVREESAEGHAASVMALHDVLPDAAPWPPPLDARAQDVATLIYTSGTTGDPKGVMLSHAAILWDAEAVTRLVAPRETDVFLSILPLAHAFERTVGCYLPMMAGAAVAFARSADTLAQDFVDIRPTVFLAVPRLYERVYAEAERRVSRLPLGKAVLAAAGHLGWGRFAAARGGNAPSRLERVASRSVIRLVGRLLLAPLGGRLRVAVSGGARLPERLGRALVGLGLPLVEGYGLTEAGPVVTGTAVDDYLPGSVGRPLAGAELRISREGELLVRSPGLMQGYWDDPSASAAAFEDGWLKTGDYGEIRDGRVFVGGRLNEVIVLSTGEKFDPEPVEAAILRDALFAQACILGGGAPFAIAVVVLAAAPWRSIAASLGLDAREPNARPAKAAILTRIARMLASFPQFVQVREVHVATEPWTVEAGLLTPTLKVKRRAVQERYGAAIVDLRGRNAEVE